jgi:hypothetical protein
VLSSEELLEKDAQHVIRAWASIAEPMPVVEGKGALLKDPEGREYIDCSSGLYRAILESYGYGIRHGLEEMATRGQDNQLKRVVATGGGLGVCCGDKSSATLWGSFRNTSPERMPPWQMPTWQGTGLASSRISKP